MCSATDTGSKQFFKIKCRQSIFKVKVFFFLIVRRKNTEVVRKKRPLTVELYLQWLQSFDYSNSSTVDRFNAILQDLEAKKSSFAMICSDMKCFALTCDCKHGGEAVLEHVFKRL